MVEDAGSVGLSVLGADLGGIEILGGRNLEMESGVVGPSGAKIVR